jgi:hypothetical protein
MNNSFLYSDKLIEINDDSILFRQYYFPTFSKSVKFSEIEKIIIEEPTLRNGKFRYWGTGDFLHWYPSDFKRSKRDVIYILFRKNKKIRIGFTVENSEMVTEILKGKHILN